MPLPEDYLVVRSELYISKSALNQIEAAGPGSKWHDAKLIPEAIERPLRTFSGLQRPGFENAICHVCLPTHRHDNAGNRIDRTPERLFLVFTDLRSYGNVVFDWEWRAGDEKTGLLLDGHDFERELNEHDAT